MATVRSIARTRGTCREKYTIRCMIELYCRRHHRADKELCDDCGHLLEYALERIGNCPHGQGKPTCGRCAVQCFKPAMRRQIQRVMRYAGPRMLVFHPLLALLHISDSFRKKT